MNKDNKMNVLIVKIGDFGLSYIMSSTKLVKSYAGTADYMSYEKAHNLPYDGRDDVWAMGCIILELLLRKRINKLGGSFYESHSEHVSRKA